MLSSATSSNDLKTTSVNNHNIHDIEYIKKLVVNNLGNANVKGSSGIPLLALAIHFEAFETTKYLLEQKADLDAADANNIRCSTRLIGTSPGFIAACLDLALEREYWPIINVFLLNNISQENINELFLTLKSLEQNTLSHVDKHRSVLLYLAIKKQLPKVVKFLLEHNVSANVTCEKLGVPLRFAIKCLDYSSDAAWGKKESSNYQANNPVMYEIIDLLLKHKADPRVTIPNRFNDILSPLTFSVHNHDATLLGLLLAHNPYLADLSPMEATTKFLCEADVAGNTPLSMAIRVKSRKMYGYLSKVCPDILLIDVEAFSEFFDHDTNYVKFMDEMLVSIPLEKRKLLFQKYTTDEGEPGDKLILWSMKKNSLSMASTLLKHGANLPIVTHKNGNSRFEKSVKKKLALSKWKVYFEEYYKDLQAAEVTPSLSQLAANVVYDHTHQSKFATEQLEGYLPPELFDLYSTTPQYREFRECHLKPVIRECLEQSLLPKDDSDKTNDKMAKM